MKVIVWAQELQFRCSVREEADKHSMSHHLGYSFFLLKTKLKMFVMFYLLAVRAFDFVEIAIISMHLKIVKVCTLILTLKIATFLEYEAFLFF